MPDIDIDFEDTPRKGHSVRPRKIWRATCIWNCDFRSSACRAVARMLEELWGLMKLH